MRVYKIRHRLPVSAYLERQKRFGHLLEPGSSPEHLAAIQDIADDNVLRLGLEDRAEAGVESVIA